MGTIFLEVRTLIFSLGVAVCTILLFGASGANAQTLHVLYDFCGKTNCTDGLNPSSGLAMDSHGNLYGTTSVGGKSNDGTIFRLTPVAHEKWKYEVIYDFCSRSGCGDGANPGGTLVVDTSGGLYGVTVTGGAHSEGNVFLLSPGSKRSKWKLHVLHSFCAQTGCSDGYDPIAGLAYAGQASGTLYDGKSPLYGTTAGGGANSQGIAFELDPSRKSWTWTVLYSFCTFGGSKCTDGSQPFGGLLVAQSGNLYGTTFRGGSSGGVVFEITPNGSQSVESVLYTFCSENNCTDGSGPSSALAVDQSGNFYGTTVLGGQNGAGVAFELSSAGSESVLHNFCLLSNCTDGGEPQAGVVFDSQGNLFGVTQSGGANGSGALFELSGTNYSVLYSFCSQANCNDGDYPVQTLLADNSGHLFGTTPNGDANSGGVAFEFTPQ